MNKILLIAAWVVFAPLALADELLLCGWDEVFALQSAAGSFSTNKAWSWKAASSNLPAHLRDKFRSTDECKPIDSGRRILITSSGGGVAVVDRATGHASFYAFAGNAHSAEILPNNRVAVAASRHAEGNRVTVFDLAQPERILCSFALDSGHGVVWDAARDILWALGYDELLALRLKDWESPAPQLEKLDTFQLPDKSGHDLIAVPGSNELLLTTEHHVFLFDRDQRAFRRHPQLGERRGVKSVAIHPRTGQLVYAQAEGTNWWTSRLRALNPVSELHLPGERLYKARWSQ